MQDIDFLSRSWRVLNSTGVAMIAGPHTRWNSVDSINLSIANPNVMCPNRILCLHTGLPVPREAAMITADAVDDAIGSEINRQACIMEIPGSSWMDPTSLGTSCLESLAKTFRIVAHFLISAFNISLLAS